VWVDLTVVFGRAEGTAVGIVTARPGAGGLSRWLRTADGAWVESSPTWRPWPTAARSSAPTNSSRPTPWRPVDPGQRDDGQRGW